jgi:hypothetical protein
VAPTIFIFQCTTDVAQSVNTKVISGGVQAKNVVTERWQCEDSAGCVHAGIILCFTDVTIETGASVNGAIFAQTAVTPEGELRRMLACVLNLPARRLPTFPPLDRPFSFRKSVHWTVRYSSEAVRWTDQCSSVVPSAGPSSAPRVVAEDKQTAFSPHSG